MNLVTKDLVDRLRSANGAEFILFRVEDEYYSVGEVCWETHGGQEFVVLESGPEVLEHESSTGQIWVHPKETEVSQPTTDRQVHEDRMDTYGDPQVGQENMGLMWTGMIQNHYRIKLDHPLPTYLVDLMYAAGKLVRASFNGRHRDNYIDCRNYVTYAEENQFPPGKGEGSRGGDKIPPVAPHSPWEELDPESPDPEGEVGSEPVPPSHYPTGYGPSDYYIPPTVTVEQQAKARVRLLDHQLVCVTVNKNGSLFGAWPGCPVYLVTSVQDTVYGLFVNLKRMDTGCTDSEKVPPRFSKYVYGIIDPDASVVHWAINRGYCHVCIRWDEDEVKEIKE